MWTTPFKNHLLKIRAERGTHHKALPDEEIDRVKREIPLLEDDEIRLYFAVLAYTGMRREEIMGLRWENIDLEKGVAYVRCTVTYPGTTRRLFRITQRRRIRFAGHSSCSAGSDFESRCRRKAVTYMAAKNRGAIRDSAADMKRENGFCALSGSITTIFRTTYGTQLKESGMSSALVADMMGHADTRMVETVYARTREEGILE